MRTSLKGDGAMRYIELFLVMHGLDFVAVITSTRPTYLFRFQTELVT